MQSKFGHLQPSGFYKHRVHFNSAYLSICPNLCPFGCLLLLPHTGSLLSQFSRHSHRDPSLPAGALHARHDSTSPFSGHIWPCKGAACSMGVALPRRQTYVSFGLRLKIDQLVVPCWVLCWLQSWHILALGGLGYCYAPCMDLAEVLLS